MEGRRSARPADRGGDGIPAQRHARARLSLGAATVVAAAGLAAYAAVTASRLGGVVAIVGGLGVAVLAAALILRLLPLITAGLALLGAAYAVLFALRGGTIDVRAPLYGAALLVVAELAFASVELRAGRAEPALAARRAATLVLVAAGAVVTGLVVLAVAATPLDGGVGLEAVGVAAAVALLVALGRVAVRSP
jgi:hypothetical protein